MRTLLASAALLLACSERARSDDTRSHAPPPAAVATGATAVDDRGATWDRAVAALADQRSALARAWARADTASERARVRDRASAALMTAITRDLAPTWLGMAWGMGRTSTATRPFASGQTISCSYFVGAILGGAGFRLHDRFALGQAAALRIQRSLSGGGKVHRFTSIPPAELAERVATLGDGVYVIGLANHVGLVVVRGAAVRFVHASYLGDAVVTDEDLATSPAIAASQPKGYFVSPLVTAAGDADDWLIEQWLTGAAVGPTR